MTTDEQIRQASSGDVMTFGELADFLNLHPSLQSRVSTIYRLLRRGAVPAFKVGQDWGFSRQVIDRLVKLESRQ